MWRTSLNSGPTPDEDYGVHSGEVRRRGAGSYRADVVASGLRQRGRLPGQNLAQRDGEGARVALHDAFGTALSAYELTCTASIMLLDLEGGLFSPLPEPFTRLSHASAMALVQMDSGARLELEWLDSPQRAVIFGTDE
jgi:hypothetical protein